MFTAIGLFFGKVAASPTLRKIAFIIGAVLAACLGVYLVREQAKGEQREKDQARTKAAQAKAAIQLQKTVTQVTRDAHDATARAIQAGNDLPVVSGVDELRNRDPAIAAILIKSGG